MGVLNIFTVEPTSFTVALWAKSQRRPRHLSMTEPSLLVITADIGTTTQQHGFCIGGIRGLEKRATLVIGGTARRYEPQKKQSTFSNGCRLRWKRFRAGIWWRQDLWWRNPSHETRQVYSLKFHWNRTEIWREKGPIWHDGWQQNHHQTLGSRYFASTGQMRTKIGGCFDHYVKNKTTEFRSIREEVRSPHRHQNATSVSPKHSTAGVSRAQVGWQQKSLDDSIKIND